ncbi:MAG: hypothetical protein ABSH25_08935 [Syntrophorhabdales bacterium]|jgi:hypothetical protein
MDQHEEWDLKMSPARYLLDRRRGTHADLAQRLVKTDLDKIRRRRLTLLRLSLIAFNVLSEQLGKDIKEGTTLEAVVKEWIRECIANVTSRLDEEALDLWSLCGRQLGMKEQEEKTAASILKTCGSQCKRYGLLGTPQPIQVYPPFWKFSTAPSRYLERLGGTKAHAEEAKAAVKPFEDAIWQELKQVEAALRKAMGNEGTSTDADAILILALTRAHHSIGHDRYGDNRSAGHVGDVTFWIAHLPLLSAIR